VLSRGLRFARYGIMLGAMQFIVSCSVSRAGETAPVLDGVWSYTAIEPASSERHSAGGLLLFDHGRFVQQVVHEEPGASPTLILGNEGTYALGSGGELRLNVDHSVIIDPVKGSVRVNRHTHPVARVQRDGMKLTLRFDSGAVHSLQLALRRRPNAQIIALREGALALATPFFVLVDGAQASGTLAFGTYTEAQGTYRLNATRWSDGAANAVHTETDNTITARVNASRLLLSDGREL